MIPTSVVKAYDVGESAPRRKAVGGGVRRRLRPHRLGALRRAQLRGVPVDHRQRPAAGRTGKHDHQQRDVGHPSRRRQLCGVGEYKVGTI